MRLQAKQGFTLIEVLVTILILACGSGYVLQALAQSARVQKKVEDGIKLYPSLAMQLAKSDARISVDKNPFKNAQGSFVEEKMGYQWMSTNQFRNPLEAKAPKESLGMSVLLERNLSVGETGQKTEDRLNLVTLVRAEIPENRNS